MKRIRTIAISQPTYLPWMGYFYLIKQADVYVLLDHVQYEKNSWQSRNRVKCPKGPVWLTIPTHHKSLPAIKDVEIDNTQDWAKRHWSTLKTCYSKAPYFHVYSPFLESFYGSEWAMLAELNIKMIKYLSAQLGLSPTFMRSSELNITGKRSEMVLDICKELKAQRYLASVGAEDYMIEDDAGLAFKKAGITVEFLEYKPPKYDQLFGEYVPNLSVVDLLFNCGPDSSKSLLDQGTISFRPL